MAIVRQPAGVVAGVVRQIDPSLTPSGFSIYFSRRFERQKNAGAWKKFDPSSKLCACHFFRNQHCIKHAERRKKKRNEIVEETRKMMENIDGKSGEEM